MSTAYTIKPTEWEREDADCESWIAETVLGRMRVFLPKQYGTVIVSCYFPLQRIPFRLEGVATVNDGKAEAELYFQSRLLPALVPVPDGAQVVGVAYNPNPEGRT